MAEHGTLQEVKQEKKKQTRYNFQVYNINDLVPRAGPASFFHPFSLRPWHHEYIKRSILDQFLKPSAFNHLLANNQVYNIEVFKEHFIFKITVNVFLKVGTDFILTTWNKGLLFPLFYWYKNRHSWWTLKEMKQLQFEHCSICPPMLFFHHTAISNQHFISSKMRSVPSR